MNTKLTTSKMRTGQWADIRKVKETVLYRVDVWKYGNKWEFLIAIHLKG